MWLCIVSFFAKQTYLPLCPSLLIFYHRIWYLRPFPFLHVNLKCCCVLVCLLVFSHFFFIFHRVTYLNVFYYFQLHSVNYFCNTWFVVGWMIWKRHVNVSENHSYQLIHSVTFMIQDNFTASSVGNFETLMCFDNINRFRPKSTNYFQFILFISYFDFIVKINLLLTELGISSARNDFVHYPHLTHSSQYVFFSFPIIGTHSIHN